MTLQKDFEGGLKVFSNIRITDTQIRVVNDNVFEVAGAWKGTLATANGPVETSGFWIDVMRCDGDGWKARFSSYNTAAAQ